MSNIAIIPARGGSKRIPRKNIRNFFGKPIIAYSIETALKSQLFDEVMVSTEDEEIALIAKKCGAKVPFLRSKQNADDVASTVDVLEEVLESYKSKESKNFEFACCIYPCAPLLRAEHLKQSFLILKEGTAECSFPVVQYSYPIWRSFNINEEGFVQMNWDKYTYTPSQNLPLAYHDAGMFYFFRVKQFLKNKNLFNNAKSIVLSEMEIQDIDNETDWKLAELKWKIANNVNA